jgi:hypothetical protein
MWRDPEGTGSTVALQHHPSRCAAVTGYFHAGASNIFRCFQHNEPLCIRTSTSLTCCMQCLTALKFSSNIICPLAWSGQNCMLLGNNGGLTHTSASRLYHKWQPIRGSHTLLFSVLNSCLADEHRPSWRHWIASWELLDKYLLKYFHTKSISIA